MKLFQENQKRFRLVAFIVIALLLTAFSFTLTAHVASAQETDMAPAQDEEPFSPAVVTATTTANLNVREGPGLQYPILNTLPWGTVVGFTGFTDITGNWVQIDAADSPVGWVDARFLSNVPEELEVPPADLVEEEEPADPEDEEVFFSSDVVTATTAANLRIRQGPGLQHEILDVLPLGTVVGFTGFTDTTGNWVQVDAVDGPTGWVAAAFLSNVPEELEVQPVAVVEEEEPADPEDEEEPFSPDVVTATTTVNLRIRQGPGLQYEILDVLPLGTVVGFTGLRDTTGNWVQVDAVDGPVGWVAAGFLSQVPEDLQVWEPES